MRAMQLGSPGSMADQPLELEVRPDLDPGPGDITIGVEACAVCRTDLQIVVGDIAARRLPVVPGHQVVGRVLSVGPGVDGWAAGDRAAVGWMAGTCGDCLYCQSDRENLCPYARFTGWDRDGGFADQVNVRADFAISIEGERSAVDLAPLLCGGVIGYRSLLVSGIRPGQRLGLFGFGASASLAIQVAAHWGCEIYVYTRSEAEQKRAMDLGATWAGRYQDFLEADLDAAISFAPVGSIVVNALERLAPGGVVAVNAIHLDRIPAFDYDKLWLERQIRSVANYTRADAEEFMRLASSIPVITASETLPMDQANQALAGIESGSLTGTAVLIPEIAD